MFAQDGPASHIRHIEGQRALRTWGEERGGCGHLPGTEAERLHLPFLPISTGPLSPPFPQASLGLRTPSPPSSWPIPPSLILTDTLGSGRSLGEGNSCPPQYSCWRTLRTEETDRLQSMGSQRVRHDGVTNTLIAFLSRDDSHIFTSTQAL